MQSSFVMEIILFILLKIILVMLGTSRLGKNCLLCFHRPYATVLQQDTPNTSKKYVSVNIETLLKVTKLTKARLLT